MSTCAACTCFNHFTTLCDRMFLLISPSLLSVRRQWAEFVWRKEDGTYWCCREWHHQWRRPRTGRRPRRREAGPERRIATRGQPPPPNRQWHHIVVLPLIVLIPLGSQVATTHFVPCVQDVNSAVCLCACMCVPEIMFVLASDTLKKEENGGFVFSWMGSKDDTKILPSAKQWIVCVCV